jgi:hypothetical protein
MLARTNEKIKRYFRIAAEAGTGRTQLSGRLSNPE